MDLRWTLEGLGAGRSQFKVSLGLRSHGTYFGGPGGAQRLMRLRKL